MRVKGECVVTQARAEASHGLIVRVHAEEELQRIVARLGLHLEQRRQRLPRCVQQVFCRRRGDGGTQLLDTREQGAQAGWAILGGTGERAFPGEVGKPAARVGDEVPQRHQAMTGGTER
jgi:hypothetical protein